MSVIQLSNQGSTPFERLLGHAPDILHQWEALELSFFKSTTFDADFLEQLRRALAFSNQCRYCMAKAGPPDENLHERRLTEALSFTNKFAISHTSIGELEINRLKEYFSDPEIVELIAFCSFISASQRLGAVLGLQDAASYHEEGV